MTDMKKRTAMMAILALVVAFAMAFVLAGCGSSSSEEAATEAETATQETEAATEDAEAATEDAATATEETEAAAPATLQEYFEQNPDLYQQFKDGFQQGFTSGLGETDIDITADLEVIDNEVAMKVNYGVALDESQIAEAKPVMDEQLAANEGQMSSMIDEMEAEAGVSPITISIGYYDANGTEITKYVFE